MLKQLKLRLKPTDLTQKIFLSCFQTSDFLFLRSIFLLQISNSPIILAKLSLEPDELKPVLLEHLYFFRLFFELRIEFFLGCGLALGRLLHLTLQFLDLILLLIDGLLIFLLILFDLCEFLCLFASFILVIFGLLDHFELLREEGFDSLRNIFCLLFQSFILFGLITCGELFGVLSLKLCEHLLVSTRRF